MRDSEEDASACTLGDFRIKREIGRGGMGVVYEAEQISLRRRVALKILPFAAMLDPRHLQRFKNEALAAASLDHPNIVEVHAVGCERGVHFFAMRYVEGQTLAAVIEGMRGERREARDEEVSRSHAPRGNAPLAAPRREPELQGDECGIRSDRIEDEATPNNSVLRTPYSIPADNSALRAPNSTLDPLNPEPRTLNPPPDTLAAALSTLRETKPRDYYRTIAQLGIQAAEALDHAHQLGIVHRDIKPSNLMVEAGRGARIAEQGTKASSLQSPASPSILDPRSSSLHLFITDFGLARIESDVATGLTITGDLLGTLRYMSPEQAEGKSRVLDNRTDVYSLGITLYELLSLQPVFDGTDRQELLRRIVFDEPERLRRIDKSFPPELETIIHKSIEKRPADRYAAARELADDLRRFVHLLPIRAKPPSWARRCSKWIARHKGPFASVMASLVVIVATLIGARMWISSVENQRLEELLALEQARVQSYQAAFQSLSYALDVSEAAARSDAHDNIEYDLAQKLLEKHVPADGEPDLRGFEWYLYDHVARGGDRALQRKWKAHDSQIFWISYSPDGRHLATASADRTVKIWESHSGRLLQTLHGHEDEANCVAFSPDGLSLATAADDGMVRIWDWRSAAQRHLFHGHQSWTEGGRDGIPVQIAFSPDGRFVASSSHKLTVVWDTHNGEEFRRFPGRGASFCPDNGRIVTASGPTLTIWDLTTGEPLRELTHEPDTIWHTAWPDTHSLFVVDRGGNFRRWDLQTGELKVHPVDNHWTEFCALSPSRKLIAIASHSGRVKILDAETGVPRGGPFVHANRAFCVAFSPDERSLASVGRDQYVRIWHPVTPQTSTFTDVPGHVGAAQGAFIDSELFVYVGADGHLRTLDLSRPGQHRHGPRGPHVHHGGKRDIAYSRARSVLYARTAAGVTAWSVAADGFDQRWTTELPGPNASFSTRHALSLTSDGESLVVATAQAVFLLDTSNGQVQRRIPIPGIEGEISSLQLSHQQDALAIGTNRGLFCLHPWPAGEPVQWHRVANHAVTAMRFTPSDDRLMIAADDGTISVWNPKFRTIVAALSGRGGPVQSLAVSPDGRTLASGSDRATVVRLWNISSGRELCTLPTPGFIVHDFNFSPDGNTLAACTSADERKRGRIWLWQVDRPEPERN